MPAAETYVRAVRAAQQDVDLWPHAVDDGPQHPADERTAKELRRRQRLRNEPRTGAASFDSAILALRAVSYAFQAPLSLSPL